MKTWIIVGLIIALIATYPLLRNGYRLLFHYRRAKRGFFLYDRAESCAYLISRGFHKPADWLLHELIQAKNLRGYDGRRVFPGHGHLFAAEILVAIKDARAISPLMEIVADSQFIDKQERDDLMYGVPERYVRKPLWGGFRNLLREIGEYYGDEEALRCADDASKVMGELWQRRDWERRRATEASIGANLEFDTGGRT